MYTLKHLLLFTVQSKAGCVRAGKMFLVSVSLACLKIRMCHIKVTQIQQKKIKIKKNTNYSVFLREKKQASSKGQGQSSHEMSDRWRGWLMLSNTWAGSSCGTAAGSQEAVCRGRWGTVLPLGLLTPPPAWQSESLHGPQSRDCWLPSSVLHFLLGVVPGFPLEEAHLERQKAVILFLAETMKLGRLASVFLCVTLWNIYC